MHDPKQRALEKTKARFEVQGYCNYTGEELLKLRFGLRFAYAICTALVLMGLLLTHMTILKIAMALAFLGMFPPYHPMDYVYNFGLRHILKKPRIPPRTNQARFACGMAFLWLAATLYLFASGNITAARIVGALLLIPAGLVVIFDICIPSMIYNFLFPPKKRKR